MKSFVGTGKLTKLLCQKFKLLGYIAFGSVALGLCFYFLLDLNVSSTYNESSLEKLDGNTKIMEIYSSLEPGDYSQYKIIDSPDEKETNKRSDQAIMTSLKWSSNVPDWLKRTMDKQTVKTNQKSSVDNFDKIVQNITSSLSLKSKPKSVTPGSETKIVHLKDIFREAHRAGRVFYNRVPKTGSEGVVSFVRELQKQNGFTLVRSHNHRDKFINDSQQFELVQYIQSLQPPVFFDRHVYFTNFTKFNQDMPVYINVIRDPVERFISAFYYNKKSCKNDACRNRTLEECVAAQSGLCTFVNPPPQKDKLWITIPFFCGHHQICRIPSRQALKIAKKHASENYLVIGILEELEQFYFILDKSMPHFFSGIHENYLESKRKDEHIRHSTEYKPKTSTETRQKLKDMFHIEYEFYEFVKYLTNKRLKFLQTAAFKKIVDEVT